MKQTLHLYNFDEVDNITSYVNLVDKNDAVVVFATTLNHLQLKQLKKMFKNVNFILDINIENMVTINFNKLVELIDKYNKSLTWK